MALGIGKKVVIVKTDKMKKIGFLVELNSTYVKIRRFDGKEEVIPFSSIDRVEEFDERNIGGGNGSGN
jgi:hypothetical protein